MRRKPRRARRSRYLEMQQTGTEDQEHAVDQSVNRHPTVKAIEARVRDLGTRIEAQLRDRRAWMAYADALVTRAVEREARFFDAGFEQGLLEGRSAEAETRGSPMVRAFASRVRVLAMRSSLSRQATVAALLETARTMVLAQPKPRPSAGSGARTRGRS